MPLRKGGASKASKRAAVSADIHELTHSKTAAGKARNAGGNAHARNVAIAMRTVYGKGRGR